MKTIKSKWANSYSGNITNSTSNNWSSSYRGEGHKEASKDNYNWAQMYSGKEFVSNKALDWDEAYRGLNEKQSKSDWNKLNSSTSDSKKTYVNKWRYLYTYS